MNGKRKHFKKEEVVSASCQGEDTAPSFPVAERIFEQQGLPEATRSENGPFANVQAGMSRLPA